MEFCAQKFNLENLRMEFLRENSNSKTSYRIFAQKFKKISNGILKRKFKLENLHIGFDLTQESNRNPKTKMVTDLIMMLLIRPDFLDWLTFGSLGAFWMLSFNRCYVTIFFRADWLFDVNHFISIQRNFYSASLTKEQLHDYMILGDFFLKPGEAYWDRMFQKMEF